MSHVVHRRICVPMNIVAPAYGNVQMTQSVIEQYIMRTQHNTLCSEVPNSLVTAVREVLVKRVHACDIIGMNMHVPVCFTVDVCVPMVPDEAVITYVFDTGVYAVSDFKEVLVVASGATDKGVMQCCGVPCVPGHSIAYQPIEWKLGTRATRHVFLIVAKHKCT
ncbi:hypothetical protein IJGMMPBP_00096 [Infectious spleen and kidney necrosis virus]|uniref:ORF094 n=2 Tax=Infectious spleen and kidney necrosis virus TaxID=180170 RepID=A0A140G0R7_ISKNV|nr:ORF104L [Infectious spleen and kidney necrosis virus]QIQ54539.1 ORF095 [Angelfish iridovirus AFIV-16]QQZ00549.1 hypothetical protein IJGMMPBP_00096 [Infectious spleen and kidney necrosis virus]QXE50787.1 ORF094 [Infectious spleen and kidney necrosis virus]QXE50909.1 ORF094 [Infectious spleen and kidney necrosis virus]